MKNSATNIGKCPKIMINCSFRLLIMCKFNFADKTDTYLH